MKTVVIFISVLLFVTSLPAQCPDRNSLRQTIVSLRESKTIPDVKQLDSLLGYEKKMSQCSYRNDSTHALLLQKIGGLYANTKDFFKAVQYTLSALALVDQQKNRTDIDPTLAIRCFYNLNLFYDALKLEKKKEEAVDSCISRAYKLHTLYNFALYCIKWKIEKLFQTGDYYKCLDLVNVGESIVSESVMNEEDLERYAIQYFTWKINALCFTNQTSTAETLVTDKIRVYEKTRKASILGPLNSLYADVLLYNSRPLEAINYYKKSYAYNLKANHVEGCTQVLNNIGYTYFTSLHQYKQAQAYYASALKLATSNEALASESLNILDNIANVHVKAGNYDSAFIYFQKAFDEIEPGFNEADLLKKDKAELFGIVEYVTGLVLDKADAMLSIYKSMGQKKHLQEAIRIYQLTDRYFDKLRISQSDIQSKLFWKTNNRRLYEHAIEACYANQNKLMAFYFFEKSRSVLLNDQITQQRGMDDISLARQAQLKRNILELERTLEQTANTSKEYSDIQQHLHMARLEEEKLNKEIYDKNPSYANNYLDTATLTIQQVRVTVLKGKNSLLEIFTGDSTVYIFCITPAGEYFTKVDKKLYDSLTTTYVSLIISPNKLNKNFPGFVNIANQLYKVIFQHIQLPGGGSLIVSPDGKSFPFECLVSKLNGQDPTYLLYGYPTSYTYSAKYLANQIEINTKTGKSILGIAPVKYDKSFGLAGLPGSDVSLQNIKKEFKAADNLVMKDATRNNFLQNFCDYNIIQLYTHASDNSNHDNDPVIYFADSSLQLSHLVTDRKPLTQLIVLSACETANGKLYEGEGIFNFNRGFAALGIPAAVSNLWAVENLSTYRITELFYKYLAQGLETDVALQKAKIEFIETSSSREKQLPYFWAGTILVGKVSTIHQARQFTWQTAMMLGGVIILAAIILYNILQRRNRKSRHEQNLSSSTPETLPY